MIAFSASFFLQLIFCRVQSGKIHLEEVSFDGESYYYEGIAFGFGYLYICTGCGWKYSKNPGSCENCGGTDFYLSDISPDQG